MREREERRGDREERRQIHTEKRVTASNAQFSFVVARSHHVAEKRGERDIHRQKGQTETGTDRQREKVHQGKLATPQLSLAFLPAAETKSIL